MMSPGPPPQPIYPRNSLSSSSTMAESPRPIHATAFLPIHQLPPPIQFGNLPVATTPGFSGLVLAPLAIPSSGSSGSGGSTLPRQHPVRQQHPSRPPQSHDAPLPSPTHASHQQARTDGRKSSTFDRLLLSQSTFVPPPTTSSYDSGYDPRFSREPDDRRRSSLSTMLPSPTFPGRRMSSEDSYQQDKPQNSGYSSGFTPTAAVEECGVSALPNRSTNSQSNSTSQHKAGGRYQIQVRQQPVAARACGFGERDRRVIDPPPIVQLIVNDPSTGLSDPTEIRYPFNVVHCTLFSVDGNSDETALTGTDKRLTRRLMGTLVSSPFVGLDEESKEGCFFCFPDLSCRTHGKYRLRFVLMRLEPSNLQPEGYTPIITETLSEVFTVYTAKEFPGMRPSTALTKALKRQGCAISVKKGNEKAIGQSGSGGGSGGGGTSGKDDASGDEDAPSSGTGKTKRRRKT